MIQSRKIRFLRKNIICVYFAYIVCGTNCMRNHKTWRREPPLPRSPWPRGRHHNYRHIYHQYHHMNKKGGPTSGDSPAQPNSVWDASKPTAFIEKFYARRWFGTLSSRKAHAIYLTSTDLLFLRSTSDLDRKGGISAPGMGGRKGGGEGL